MVKSFNKFLGLDLSVGTQIVAVLSGVISLLLAYITFYLGAVNGSNFILKAEKEHPRVNDYGGSRAFFFITILIGIHNVVHFVFCMILCCGARMKGLLSIRLWLRSSIVCLCSHATLITFASCMLMAAGAPEIGAGALLALLLWFPLKVYFTLIVNSYHNSISPTAFWGSLLDAKNAYRRQRSTDIPDSAWESRRDIFF